MRRVCPDSQRPEELTYDKKASVICKLEEALLYAMSKDDIEAYKKVTDIYIVKLAQFSEYNKIRQVLDRRSLAAGEQQGLHVSEETQHRYQKSTHSLQRHSLRPGNRRKPRPPRTNQRGRGTD